VLTDIKMRSDRGVRQVDHSAFSVKE